MDPSDTPPSLPSSSAPPIIRISSTRFSSSSTSSPLPSPSLVPESPRTPSYNLERTQALLRESSLARSGSGASTRSGTSGGYLASRAGTPTGALAGRASANTRPRSPPPTLSSHASGILPPASFFRVAGTGPQRSVAGPGPVRAGSMPLGPTKHVHAQSQSHPLQINVPSWSTTGPRIGAISPASPRSPGAGAGGSVSDSEAIPLGPVSPRRMSDSAGKGSFFGGGGEVSSDSEAHYPIAGHRAGPLYRNKAKASREPLLPTKARSATLDSAFSLNAASLGRGPTPTSNGGVSPAAGATFGGKRRSTESSRLSLDLEQGLRDGPLEHRERGNSSASADLLRSQAPSRGPPMVATRPSSIARSDALSQSLPYPATLGGGAGGGTNSLRNSKLTQITRDSPKTTIHPHPIIIPASPLLHPKTHRPILNHERIPSKNTFFLKGRLLTGGDSPVPFMATLTLIFGLGATWFACTAPWYWEHVSPAVPAVAAYMTLFSLASLFMTAFRDPGILPRNLDEDPPMARLDDDDILAPLPRDIRVRAGVVRIKYCPSCKLYRPPRSSHCRLCDNCVESCDHHCQWVNNCVGRRNYFHFFTFLIAIALTNVFIIVTSALHIYLKSHRDHTSFRHALDHTVGSAVCFVIAILTIWPVLTLLGYHCRLVLLNITTIEQVRSAARNSLDPDERHSNPFTLGKWTKNVAYILCRPPGYSWIQADEVVMEDKRELNPGSQGWKGHHDEP